MYKTVFHCRCEEESSVLCINYFPNYPWCNRQNVCLCARGAPRVQEGGTENPLHSGVRPWGDGESHCCHSLLPRLLWEDGSCHLAGERASHCPTACQHAHTWHGSRIESGSLSSMFSVACFVGFLTPIPQALPWIIIFVTFSSSMYMQALYMYWYPCTSSFLMPSDTHRLNWLCFLVTLCVSTGQWYQQWGERRQSQWSQADWVPIHRTSRRLVRGVQPQKLRGEWAWRVFVYMCMYLIWEQSKGLHCTYFCTRSVSLASIDTTTGFTCLNWIWRALDVH